MTDEPYPGEFADPVAGGAFSKTRPMALPTADSVRIPVDVRLADGYRTEGAELAHPTPFSEWTETEIKEVLESLLRTLCVRAGEEYDVSFKWVYGQGAVLSVESGPRTATTDWLPVGLSVVAAFTGHDRVPDKGIAKHHDTMRFNDSPTGGE